MSILEGTVFHMLCYVSVIDSTSFTFNVTVWLDKVVWVTGSQEPSVLIESIESFLGKAFIAVVAS